MIAVPVGRPSVWRPLPEVLSPLSYIILIPVAAWAFISFAIAGAGVAPRSRSRLGPLPPTRHPHRVRANDLA